MKATADRESVRDMVIRYAQKYEGPVDVANAILDDIESADIRGAFQEVLPDYCRNVLTQQRRRNSSTDNMVELPSSSPATSAKTAAIRAWFGNFLASQLHTESGWKRMGDCTKSDLMFSAMERRTNAERVIRQADELEALASALDKHKKQALRDLPESVVRSVLSSVR